MERKNNDLVQFLIGLAMLVAGGYAFLARISVHSNIGGRMMLGNIGVAGGLIVVPFIVGIMMLFAMPKKFISKLVTGLGLLLIVVYVIMNINFSFRGANAYEYLLMLVGMFGGLALVLKVLLSDPDRFKDDYDSMDDRESSRSRKSKNVTTTTTTTTTTSANSVEDELEAMKKKYDK